MTKYNEDRNDTQSQGKRRRSRVSKRKLAITISIFCLVLIAALVVSPGCATPVYVSEDTGDEISRIIRENRASIAVIGNPLGEEKGLTEKRYFGKSACWVGAGIGITVTGIGAIFCPPVAFGIPVAAALGYGGGRGLQAYYGGPYDYDAYRVPEKPGVVVVWFSGADEGACGHKDFGPYCDYCRASREFGDQCVAMFNFSDVDKALEYSAKLPEGTQLIVRGHSMGGSAAMRFSKKLPPHLSVLLLDTRDACSWFNHIGQKPENVRYWRNVLPGEAQLFIPEEKHPRTNYIGRINAANLFMMLGGPWGICPGATNIVLEGKDHHEIAQPIDADSFPISTENRTRRHPPKRE